MFRSRYYGVGGYREVLTVSLPLVISMASNTLMQFTDRMFLASYSVDAIAAAMPAGMAAFLGIAFFMGTGGYANVFVAQYVGAGRPQRV
ncbi:MATE family efflux transporter, partial [Desulfocurvibacter africanus]